MKQSQVVGTVRALWPFLRPERRHLIQAAGVTLALTAVEVTLPILAGQVVDSLLAGARGAPASAPDLRQLTQKLAKQGTRFAAINGQLQGFGADAVAASSALMLEVAAGEISTGRLTAGDLVAFYALLGLLLPVIQRLVTANRYLQLSQVSVDRLRSTLAQRPESFGDDRLPDLAVRAGVVDCAGVSYRYPDGSPDGPPVLQHVGLEARRGQLVAIARRPRRMKVLHVVGLDAQGRRHSIPYRYYGSGGLNQVRRQLRYILLAGRGEALCREVATRLARDPAVPLGRVVTVQIVAGRCSLDGFYRGDLTVHRERVRAVWPPVTAGAAGPVPEALEVAL